jgi:DNA uptake protein ComE-like DNA-binding protein
VTDSIPAAAPVADAPPASLFQFDPNTASKTDFTALGLPERVAQSIINYRSKGGQFRKPEDFQKIYTLTPADYARLRPYIRIGGATETPPAAYARPNDEEPSAGRQPEMFPFDPNQASEADLRRLGLPARIASNMVRYREKGGQFRRKEDLLKIYGFADEDYARLEPFISLPGAQAEASAPRPVMYSSGTAAAPTPPVARKTSAIIDVNGASIEDWQGLPGIGAARARWIVNFRDKLGGFLSVAQVGETRNLPDSVFQEIKPFLKAELPLYGVLDLNTVTLERLKAHPYFSEKQARLIVDYRTQHGRFAAVDDLHKILAFTDKQWLAKVKPYLTAD